MSQNVVCIYAVNTVIKIKIISRGHTYVYIEIIINDVFILHEL